MKAFIRGRKGTIALTVLFVAGLITGISFMAYGISKAAHNTEAYKTIVKLSGPMGLSLGNTELDRALVDGKADDFRKDSVFAGSEWNTFRSLNDKSVEADARVTLVSMYDQLDSMEQGFGSTASAQRQILQYRAYMDAGTLGSDANDANFLAVLNTVKDSCTTSDPSATVAAWRFDSAKHKPVLGSGFEQSEADKAVVTKAFQKAMSVGVKQICS